MLLLRIIAGLLLFGVVSLRAEPRQLLTFSDFNPTDPAITWEEENGTRFLRLTTPKPEVTIEQKRTIPLPADVKGVDLFVRFRVANFKFGAGGDGKPSYGKDMHFRFKFLDAAGKAVPKSGGGFVFDSHAKTWTNLTRRVLVPAGATQLEIAAGNYKVAAGTLDLAEIRVTAMPDAEAEALIQANAAAAKKAADDEAALPAILALPPTTVELKVAGNKLVTPTGQEVWLQGVNVCSLEWSAKGENVLRSIKVAIDDWKANVIRLPVHDKYWLGAEADAYRLLVDNAIKLAAARGAYVILDLHRFHSPDEKAVEFWKDAGARYANHPAVLFDLFNEPTMKDWGVWRNGGTITYKDKTVEATGMQTLLETVRRTGARNIIVAGGIGYAYDLSGVLNGFALEDKSGNGIVYATHFYNWHRGWEQKFLALAEKYPLLVGEFGADVKKMSFVPAKNQEDPYTWSPDALALVQKYRLHWTAFSFHPKATPVLLKNWDYEPTPFWGAFVKDALAGKSFELQKLR
ncbi:MAG: hypothetical protein PCFJNLEI_01010 [Verrucomicrobiae bacterium]|nr:hypothetical protein [Verrucomicrobiae bacterium]